MKSCLVIALFTVLSAVAAGGSHATQAAPVTTGSGLHLKSPTGIAVDKRGNVYVADWGNNRVVELSPKGKLVASFGGSLGLNHPMAVAVASNGTVYIADTGNHRVIGLTRAGRRAQLLPHTYSDPDPTGLSVASNGSVYVADPTESGIGIWNPNDTSMIGYRGGWSDEYYPSDVLTYGKVQASSSPLPGEGGPTVVELDSRLGLLVISPPNDDPVTWNTYTKHPTGLARDSKGIYYVADGATSVVRLVIHAAADSISHTAWKHAGIAGSFAHPWGVAVDSHDNVYVTDSGHNRVVKLSRKGKLLAVWR